MEGWVAVTISIVVCVLTFVSNQLGLRRRASLDYVESLEFKIRDSNRKIDSLTRDVDDCHKDRQLLTEEVSKLRVSVAGLAQKVDNGH